MKTTGESVCSSVDSAEDSDQITSTTSGLLRAFIADHCSFLVDQDGWIARAEELELPLNPLDELIDELGPLRLLFYTSFSKFFAGKTVTFCNLSQSMLAGGPDKVAELTGRSGRHVRRQGRWIWEKRAKCGTDTKNIAEV